jgi:hypothetical protein
MKTPVRQVLWIAAAGLTGCASEATDHSVHWVELTADRNCTGDSYAPGARLCQFLATTTSPDVDRARALECLHDTVVDRYTDGQLTTVRYTARLAQYTDRLVVVRVEYPADTQVKSALKISAQRESALWVKAH